MTTVKHVQEALSMLRIKSFDLVLSDIHMPDTNGFELLRQVDEEFNLPVIRKSLCMYISESVYVCVCILHIFID